MKTVSLLFGFIVANAFCVFADPYPEFRKIQLHMLLESVPEDTQCFIVYAAVKTHIPDVQPQKIWEIIEEYMEEDHLFKMIGVIEEYREGSYKCLENALITFLVFDYPASKEWIKTLKKTHGTPSKDIKEIISKAEKILHKKSASTSLEDIQRIVDSQF